MLVNEIKKIADILDKGTILNMFKAIGDYGKTINKTSYGFVDVMQREKYDEKDINGTINYIEDYIEHIERNIKNIKNEMRKPPDIKMKEFIKYFLDFYGEDGLSPIKGLTKNDIIKGVEIRLKESPNIPFEGDSVDREEVRDVILKWRHFKNIRDKK